VAKKAHEVWPKNTVTAVVRATFASCTWKVKSVIFPGIGGTSSSIAENDSCHWYYRARARCLDTVGAGHYAYGLWRNSTRNSSIAYCGKNYKLTESWFQKYRDGKYYEVYPHPAPGVAAVTQ
jgi:hypothetical protein